MIDHSQVIYKRYAERKTYQVIANEMGVCRERIRQILVDKHGLVTKIVPFKFEGIERSFERIRSKHPSMRFKVTPNPCIDHGERIYRLNTYKRNWGLAPYCYKCSSKSYFRKQLKRKGINLQLVAEQLSAGLNCQS